jgi:hypothetical protein
VKRASKKLLPSATLLAALLLQPASLLACATCYGASDSPLAQGMNWGIMTLLVIVFSVMCGIVGFFVHVNRRARRLSGLPGQ